MILILYIIKAINGISDNTIIYQGQSENSGNTNPANNIHFGGGSSPGVPGVTAIAGTDLNLITISSTEINGIESGPIIKNLKL